MDTKDPKPALAAVSNVKPLEQPLSTAEAAIKAFNDPTNMENVITQANIDACFARIRYDAFIGQNFTEDQALTLVIEAYGGYSD